MPSRGDCPSVTFMYSVEMTEHIINFFHHLIYSIATILVFHNKPYGTILTVTVTPLTGASMQVGRQKSRLSANIWLSIDDCWSASNNCDGRPCSLSHSPPSISESCVSQPAAWTITTKRREQNVQNLIVRSGKSETEVTYKIALDVLYYWSYWQTRSIARPLCDKRATCKCTELWHITTITQLSGVFRWNIVSGYLSRNSIVKVK